MKKTLFIMLGMASLLMLTSCSTTNGYPKCNANYGYCKPVVQRYPCKVMLDRCEKICNSCTFGGPACATCWACINYSNCNKTCKSCGY